MIHKDLHFVAHNPHLLHFVSLILILNKDNLLKYPKIVPTGQIELQYVRPQNADNIMIIKKVVRVVIKENILEIKSGSL